MKAALIKNRQKLSMVILFMLLLSRLYAGRTPQVSELHGQELQNATTHVFFEDHWVTMLSNPNWNQEFLNASVDNVISLHYTGQEFKHYADTWSIAVNFEVTTYDENENVLLNAEPVTLTIDFDNADGMTYQDKDLYTFNGAHKVEINNLVVTPSSELNGIVPEDVFLTTTIDVDRYYKLDPTQAPAINASSNNHKATLYWAPIEGAEEYDLEWCFISAHSTKVYNTPSDIENLRFTRVTIKENQYELNLVYEAGTLFYRVRGVGRYWAKLDQPKPGAWSNDASDKITINNYHQADKNWTYQAMYAEDGKRKEVVTYVDGSSRGRQTVTLANTEQQAIVGEVYYDFEGRAAVQALPAPTTDRSNSLTYYQNFNLNNHINPTAYNKTDFALDVSGTSCAQEVAAMSTSSGVSNYYSSQNPEQDGYNAYIPDAGKLPFSQTIYGRDGRVKMMAGPGESFAFGSGHETKYLYARPSQDHLDQLFGNEVGLAKHYTLTAIQDPNGQVNVSYQNLSGQTIATFLAGQKPASLDEIEGNTVESNIEKNLILFNTWFETEQAYIVSDAHPITNPGTYNFNYTVTPQTFSGICNSPTYDCHYDLTITVTNDCGELLYTNVQQVSPSMGTLPISFSVNFPQVGEYDIKKELTLNQQKLQEAAAAFENHLNSANNDCFNDLISQQADAQAIIDWENCQNCVNFCTAHPNLCNAADCEAVPAADFEATCQDAYDQMVTDMSPGGQYFDNQYQGTTQGANNGWFQINVVNQWNNSTHNVAGFWTDFGLAAIGINNWNQLKNNWNPNWATNLPTNNGSPYTGLVSFHPEACHHLWCQSKTASNNYDYQLNHINTFDAAVAAGYINGTSATSMISYNGIYQQDPALNDALLTGPLVNLNTYLQAYITATSWNDARVAATNNPITGILKDDTWLNYRNNYIAEKNKEITLKEANHCPFMCDTNDPANQIYPDNIADANSGTLNCNGHHAGFKIRYNTSLSQLAQSGMLNPLPGQNIAQNWANDLTNSMSNCFATLDFPISSLDICAGATGNNVAGTTPRLFIGSNPVTAPLTILQANATRIPALCANNITPAQWAEAIEHAINTSGTIGINAQLTSNTLTINVSQIYAGKNIELTETTKTNFHYPLAFLPVDMAWNCPTMPSCICTDISQQYDEHYQQNNNLTPNQIFALIQNEYTHAYGYNISINTIQSWYNQCQSQQQLTTAQQNDITNNYPQVMANCPSQFDPCATEEVNNLSNYYISQQYQQQVQDKVDEFILAYQEHCMGELNEQFTLTGSQNNYHYTLFYYDQAGNLVKTVPPAGVNLIPLTEVADVQAYRANPNAPGAVRKIPPHELESHYQYNSFNQLVTQTTPDGGTKHMWYDQIGRSILSQDAQQAVEPVPEYSYVKYDAQGRPTENGVLATANVPTDNDLNVSLNPNFPDNINQWTDGNGNPLYKEVTQTDYDAITTAPAPFTAAQQAYMRTRVAASYYWEQTDDPNYLTASFFSYDVHGNVKHLVQENKMLEELNQHLKRMEYHYDLISGNVNQLTYQKDQPDQFMHQYCYDADNRITEALTSHDGQTWDRDAKYQYYQHGPLARVELGQQKVQGIDYAYNLLGWLKGVNANQLTPELDMGKDGITGTLCNPPQDYMHSKVAQDAFGFTLGYFGHTSPGNAPVTDYTAIGANANQFHDAVYTAGGSLAGNLGQELYNGNIRHMSTALMDIDQQKIDINTSVYTFDQLNRIKSAQVNLGADYSSMVNNQDYHTEYTFDANGNLQTLLRNAFTDTDPNTGHNNQMDNFIYRYKPGTNQLDHVEDLVTTTGAGTNVNNSYGDIQPGQIGNNYQYNQRGDLINDASENLHNEWYQNGKLKATTHDPGSQFGDVEFRYDPQGNRIMKLAKSTVTGQNNWVYTYYVRDAQGNVMATYQKHYTNQNGGTPGTDLTEHLKLQEQHLYGSSRVGLKTVEKDLVSRNLRVGGYRPDGTFQNVNYLPAQEATTQELEFNQHHTGQKMYELTNHLGNVLVVITDKRLYDAEIATDQNDVPVKLDYENYLSTWSAQTPGACTTPAQFSINNGKLQIDFPPFVTPCAGNSADYKINTVAGETYTVSLKAERGVATDVIAIETRDHINNTVIPTAVWGINIQPGVMEPCIEFTFTATSSETRLKIFSRSAGFTTPTVLYIDEMQILAFEHIVVDVVSFSDYYPFGWEMPGRNGGSVDYRYGFQAQEKDDEVKGRGNSMNYRYRAHDPRACRFFAVDPLAPKYPHNSPYAFSENRLLDAIELEGLEAYFIHGTNGSPSCWNEYDRLRPGIREHFGNKERKDEEELLIWSGANNSKARKIAAKDIARLVIENYDKNSGEPITLVGSSHGGNVALLASKIIRESLPDAQINLLTLNTPVRKRFGYQLSHRLTMDPNFLHYNFYIHTDYVQGSNGGANDSGVINDAEVGIEKGLTGPKGFLLGKLLNSVGIESTLGGEKGPAGRTFDNGKTWNFGHHNQYGIDWVGNIEKRHQFYIERHADLLLKDLEMTKDPSYYSEGGSGMGLIESTERIKSEILEKVNP